MAEYSRMSFGMFGGSKVKVRIQFAEKMVGIFYDRFGSDIAVRPDGDGMFHINVSVAVSPQFYGWIFSLGPQVKITAPGEVVSGMREYMEEIAHNYV